jgi:hypothetical protein
MRNVHALKIFHIYIYIYIYIYIRFGISENLEFVN